MTTAAAVLAVAERYVGTKETPKGSNRQQFGVWYGMNGVPWCAIFVSFCMWAAGFRWADARTAKGFSYCPDIVAWGKRHGRISRTPHVGDLAVAVDGPRPHHVEFVRRVLPGGRFEGLGGNTGPSDLSNGGQVMIHPHSVKNWVFISPPYAPAAAPQLPAKPKPAVHGPIKRNIALTSPFARGTDVKWAQQKLAGLGLYNGQATGVYDERTHQAVVAFQRREHLTVDGVLGPISGDHLAAARSAAA